MKLTHQKLSIKAVVSSRPESIFVDRLSLNPSFKLEQFTHDDIQNYVSSRLQNSSKFRTMQGKHPLTADRLIQLIVSRASGVFLWVKLVVRSVLLGLGDGNSFHELEKLVEEYPEEIHDLFVHMFSRLRPAYKAEASKLFQYIIEGKRAEGEAPNAFRLRFIDRDDPSSVLELQRKPLEWTEASEMLDDMKARLTSRCCGFLNIRHPDNLNILAYPDEVRIAFLH